ncbi:DUF389 domain-containing protein [Coralloluteibacterium thermophilus]|uniref:DUF389 domain-containing protein n=1 Tax=Coralloluteibacterium thermophilum TaxID=2707049 RepID=A0ABV9NJ35_9GAMM
MPRKAEIRVAPTATDALLDDLARLDGLFELRLQRGVVVVPRADLVTVVLQNRALQDLMRILDRHRLGEEGGVSVVTSEPDSVVETGDPARVDRDSNEGSWEEMEAIISKDSNAGPNTLLLIVAAGVLTAVGIAMNEIHIAIGGMLVAPAFMPIMRISLGLVAGSAVWRRGVVDTLKLYLVLAASAAACALAMRGAGLDPLDAGAGYYAVAKPFFQYWTTTNWSGVSTSAAAALAGALLIVTKRSTFTSGVMIGLALVPSASLVGMELVAGNPEASARAALRWLTDVALVLAVSAAVFAWERRRLHRRDMRM